MLPWLLPPCNEKHSINCQKLNDRYNEKHSINCQKLNDRYNEKHSINCQKLNDRYNEKHSINCQKLNDRSYHHFDVNCFSLQLGVCSEIDLMLSYAYTIDNIFSETHIVGNQGVHLYHNFEVNCLLGLMKHSWRPAVKGENIKIFVCTYRLPFYLATPEIALFRRNNGE